MFIAEAPFINIDFLTQKPQTLHVYEPKEIYDQISQLKNTILEQKTRREEIGSSDIKVSREIQNNIKTLQAQVLELDIKRKENRLLFSDQEHRALAQEPDKLLYHYKNYAYSGGGIGPAIIGTF